MGTAPLGKRKKLESGRPLPVPPIGRMNGLASHQEKTTSNDSESNGGVGI